jgi:hypothetical protein
MSKHLNKPWPIDHPEIVAIAVDLMRNPARRACYSALVLMLADAALEKISLQLSHSSRMGDNRTLPPQQFEALLPKSEDKQNCQRCDESGCNFCDLGYIQSPA